MAGFTIENILRPCLVQTYRLDEIRRRHMVEDVQKKALFHQWMNKSEIYPPSAMVGGHPGGIVSGTLGIVEFEDGKIAEVNPTDITFIDHKFDEYAFGENNPLAHPESYLEDAKAIARDMTMAQRKELQSYLENLIKFNL